MGRNFIKDRGVTKSHILFLCLAILTAFIIIVHVDSDKKNHSSIPSHQKTQYLQLKVHKIDSLLESYNKSSDRQKREGKVNPKPKPKAKVNPKPKSKAKEKDEVSIANQKQVKAITNQKQVEAIANQRLVKATANQRNSISFDPYQILKEDKAPHAFNKLTNNINIMIYWVDGKRLKVLSILSINQKTHKIAVITVPLFGQFLNKDKVVTIGDYYYSHGREDLTILLEKLLEVNLDNYVLIQQETLGKVSSMVGPLVVNGETLYIDKAFEQTAAGLRKDDEDIVRALGERLVSSSMWLKIPQLVWIFSREVETNLNGGQIWDIYKEAKGIEIGKLNKKPILGIDYELEGKEYRVLLARIYKNIIYDLTR